MRKIINRLKRIKWLEFIQRIVIFIIAVGVLSVLVTLLTFNVIDNSYKDDKYSFDEIDQIENDKYKVAIVFGAGLSNDFNNPSDVLKDRIKTGVELYKQGKVKRIIMSGDNRFEYYDEPTVMIDYAKSLGIPEDVLQPDYAGRRTYDTCYRANKIFGLNEAILVTQDFHLTRAMYVCDHLGVTPIGVKADLQTFRETSSWQMRDKFALMLALWEVNIAPPNNVVLGEKIELQ